MSKITDYQQKLRKFFCSEFHSASLICVRFFFTFFQYTKRHFVYSLFRQQKQQQRRQLLRISSFFANISNHLGIFRLFFKCSFFFRICDSLATRKKANSLCVSLIYIYVHNNLITAFATEQQKITLMRNVSSTYFLVCSDAISVKNLSVLVTDWTKLTF